ALPPQPEPAHEARRWRLRRFGAAPLRAVERGFGPRDRLLIDFIEDLKRRVGVVRRDFYALVVCIAIRVVAVIFIRVGVAVVLVRVLSVEVVWIVVIIRWSMALRHQDARRLPGLNRR